MENKNAQELVGEIFYCEVDGFDKRITGVEVTADAIVLQTEKA